MRRLSSTFKVSSFTHKPATSMESEPAFPKQTLTTRSKCSACFKQFKKKEHLVEHMKHSFHSVHQPRCPICKKHCKSFESLREHLTGPLAKGTCLGIFSESGCGLCLKVFDDPISLEKHKEACCLSAPSPLGMIEEACTDRADGSILNGTETRAIAIDCEMVGGGMDGTLSLCARVCLVDEDENLIFHAYVQPQIPVTNFRSEVTGLTEEYLRNAVPLKEVQERVSQILHNGENVGIARLDGGKAKLLVGHDLMHDLDCLNMYYPNHLLRDTAKYKPLMKTNFVSHSLKYLTRTYLGYDIQTGLHDPYEDCVSATRIYKRVRAQEHREESLEALLTTKCAEDIIGDFDSLPIQELEKLTPDELLRISTSNYKCWCLDQDNNRDT